MSTERVPTFKTLLAALFRDWARKLDPSVTTTVPAPAPPAPPAFAGTRYFFLGLNVAMARLEDGHHIFVDPHDRTVGSHLIAHGYWEKWIHHTVCRLVSPGDRIVEVGANLGYYTLAMAVMVGPDGHITAFEGNPRMCRLTRRTLEFNGYGNRVDVRNQAATDVAGTLTFSISRTNSGGGHASVHPGQVPPDMEQIEVEGVRLDDAIEGEVDFLRMDAEGSEPLILRGAERLLQNPNLTVVMEWDVFQMSGRASVPDLVDWLTGMGFHFWRIEHTAVLTPVAAADLPTLSACDVVMSRNAPALS